MIFLARACAGPPARLAIFPGSFHPVTRAHMALAEAALEHVDEVVFVMPRRFPHKEYEGVGLEDRIALVRRAAAGEERFSVAITEGGLFRETAAECRGAYGPETELWLLCGRDAAERIAAWDYGSGSGFLDQLRDFGLLVAARAGHYQAPPEAGGRVRPVALRGGWDEVSATGVRERIAAGLAWRHLVPEAVAEDVERLYGAPPALP